MSEMKSAEEWVEEQFKLAGDFDKVGNDEQLAKEFVAKFYRRIQLDAQIAALEQAAGLCVNTSILPHESAAKYGERLKRDFLSLIHQLRNPQHDKSKT